MARTRQVDRIDFGNDFLILRVPPNPVQDASVVAPVGGGLHGGDGRGDAGGGAGRVLGRVGRCPGHLEGCVDEAAARSSQTPEAPPGLEGTEEMVEDLEDGDEGEAHAEAEQAARVGHEGDDRNFLISHDPRHHGILNVNIDDGL